MAVHILNIQEKVNILSPDHAVNAQRCEVSTKTV